MSPRARIIRASWLIAGTPPAIRLRQAEEEYDNDRISFADFRELLDLPEPPPGLPIEFYAPINSPGGSC